MNDLVIVICNWNKRNDLIKCLDSVALATSSKTEVIVVDNASSDGSVEMLESYRVRPIRLIKNKENLGGTGGFNTGLREALSGNYKYVHLLDNDVIVDENTFRNSYDLLENEPSIGAVGSKLYQLDAPKKLQEMGAQIDWTSYQVKPLHSGIPDSTSLPELVESDYVPACSVMIRMERIRNAGLMDQACFLYWDDIEWFDRIRQDGHRVVAYERSKAWHKMGVKKKTNTLGTYYFQRNRIGFFATRTDENEIDQCIKTIFEDLFQSYYFSRLEGKFNTAKTILRAARDALNHIRGKAPHGRIEQCEDNCCKFVSWVSDQTSISLVYECNVKTKSVVIETIQMANPKVRIYEKDQRQPSSADSSLDRKPSQRCHIVNHVVDLIDKHISPEVCCVDRFLNSIITEQDRKLLSLYSSRLRHAQEKFIPKIKLKVTDLRSNRLTEKAQS